MKRNRSKRTAATWLGRIVLVAGLLGVFLLSPFSGSQERDDATITSYDVDMSLSADGGLTSTENVSVLLPAGKHGIFKIFDTADPRRDIEHPVQIDSISRDGQPEPYEILDGAGTTTAKIGSASVTLSGPTTYTIESRTVDAIEPGEDGTTVWWWDVIGAGWQMPINSAAVRVELPATPESVECVMGEDSPCTASVEGQSLSVRTGALEPFTPVTVRVTFPEGALPMPPDATSSNTVEIILAVIAGVLAALAGLYLIRATREKEPGFPVLFEPPEGVSPALGAKVLDEVDSPDDLQATLFDLGERGVVTLAGDDDRWTVTLVADPSTVSLWPAETAVLNALGLRSAGQSFVVSKSVTSGKAVAAADSALKAAVGVAAAPYLTRSSVGTMGWFLGWLAALAAVVQIGIYFFGDTGWVYWPTLIGAAVFAFFAMGVMFDIGALTTRTRAGRDVWSRTGGFARFLSTDSSESRFDASAHMDWYPRYLPWAVALGSAEEWAKRYEAQGVTIPEVPWLFWAGTGHYYSMNRMSDSFNSAIAGSAAAYAASQSSSGSGGGFSGGSGGGGGGGGSW